jgi:mRNA interferase RelE/StbE
LNYELIFDRNAIKFLEKCDDALKKRIFDKICSAREEPFRFFRRLEGRSDYRLRVGDYRVIADISNERKTIEVTLIGHRKNIYEK